MISTMISSQKAGVPILMQHSLQSNFFDFRTRNFRSISRASFLSNFQMRVQTDDSRVIKGGKKANSSCCTGWHFHAPNIVTQKLLGDKRKFDQ